MKALLKSSLFSKNNCLKALASFGLWLGVNLTITQAQVNTMINGDFEQYTTCPEDADGWFLATGWDTIRAGCGENGTGPEYANACSKGSGSYSVGVPSNYAGYQNAHSGKGYFVYAIYESDSDNYIQREYIQGRFKSKLILGKVYCVSFYVSLSNSKTLWGAYAVDELGGYLDDGSISVLPKGTANVIPQIKSPRVGAEGGSYLEDTLNWMKIQGTYTANGTEQYITLGNFRDYKNTNAKMVGACSLPSCGGHYYFDDVSVVEINTQANAGNDTTIIKGDTAFVGLHDIGDAYTWYANGTAFYTGSEAGLYVTPTINTTYVCKQTVCSVVTYDTCVITVKPVGIKESLQFERLKVWPVPVESGELKIESEKLLTSIEVYNVLGEKVKDLSVNSKQVAVDVSALPKGMYMLRLSDAKGNSVIRKVVIDN